EPLRGSIETGDKFLETLRKEIVARLPGKLQSRRGEILFVEIAPAAPDRFIHQSIDVVEMNRLHRFQKLESEMKKTRLVFAGKRIEIFQAGAPDPAVLRILCERPRDLAQRRGRGVLSGELRDSRAAMHLDRKIPKRRDHA